MGAVVLGIILSCVGTSGRPDAGETVLPQEIVDLPRVRDVCFDPTGEHIVYSSDASSNWSLYKVSLETQGRTQLTFSPEAEIGPEWSPNGDLIAYLSDYGGDGKHDIYVIPAEGASKGRRPRRLTTDPGDDCDIHWSPNGARLAFASDREPRPDGKRGYGIYWTTMKGGEEIRLTRSNGDDHEPRWSPLGDRLAFTSTRDVGLRESDIYMVPMQGGEATKLTTHEGGRESHPRWRSDGDAVYFQSDDSGFVNVGMHDLRTGDVVWQTEETDDVLFPEPTPPRARRSMITYSFQHEGNSILEIVSGDPGRDLLIKMDDHIREPGIMENPRWSPDGASLAFVFSGPTNPGQIWIFHRAEGRAAKIVEAKGSAALTERLVAPEVIEYETKEGEIIEAFLYGGDPKAPAKRAVVWLHDGPRGHWMNGWSPEVQTLVSGGCVVLAPNFRGSTGYGLAFESLNDRRWGDLEFPDILGAADHLRKGGYLSLDARIGVGGVGYGGFLALLIAAREKDAWDGAISLGGWVDLEDTFGRASSLLQREILDEVGDPGAGKDWFSYLSPLKHGARIRCPVLLISMDRHALVDRKNVQALAKTLRKHGTPLELEILHDDGQGPNLRKNRRRALSLLDEFVQRNL